ncbi:MAG: FtsX-like permease family protein [Oscillospiraceae bacterium]|nr:FtsX-like permease family protein [Oscillospiraceae bacterium]
MFERLLALRYIKAQKRHSFFTVCSIAVALALVTLLFIAFSTYMGIRRDAAYYEKPYHFKLMQLTEEEFAQLETNPDFTSCERITEADGSLSAAIMINTYHEDFGLYINTIFPDKYLYSDLKETYKEDLIDVNFELVELDRLDFASKYYAVYRLALFFIFIIFFVLALRLMIDTAFEISSKERERQYGILQCTGAAPGQIVRIITWEGLFLSIVGIPVGILLGLGLSFGVFQAIRSSGVAEAFFTAEEITAVMKLHCSPLLLVLGAVTGLVWVMISAYGTGMRIIRMSPIQAISNRENKIRKVRRFSLLGLLFGWKGMLAARNNRRQTKRFVVTVMSLTVSILLVASFSLVLRQAFAAFEKTVEVLDLDYDFGVNIKVDPADPLSYKEGLGLIRESGYFDIDTFTKTQLAYIPFDEDSEPLFCLLLYYPEETFDSHFIGGSPVPYETLTEQGSYLITHPTNFTEQSLADVLKKYTQFDVVVQGRTLVTDDAYNAMTAEEQAQVEDYVFDDPVTGEHALLYRYLTEWTAATLPVGGSAPAAKTDAQAKKFFGVSHDYSNMLLLAGTLDAYENGAYAYAGSYGSLINSDGTENIRLVLRDDSTYEEAKAFLLAHDDVFELDEDFFGDLRKGRTTVGAIQIGFGFLSVLIGLIAIVNMVNTISTGMLNRKHELAALQCIGMTQGQLRAMTVIECLQYALTSGIAATVTIEVLFLEMYLFLKVIGLEEVFGEIIHFTEPLPLIWISAAVVFLAAAAASFIPLQRMQKDSLTDQLRCVE